MLVLESRERVGGACTIEEPFPDVRMSPCAYLAGLLHPLVIEELNLPERGFEWTPAVNGLFVPFLDGSSIQLWDDDARCEEEVRRFSPGDVEGWRAMNDVIRRLRDAVRPANGVERDDPHGPTIFGSAMRPRRSNLKTCSQATPKRAVCSFHWSMAEFVERYLADERLQSAYLGQGVIGTNASPFDAGTASIRFHHSSGRLGGMPGMWGYVKGGMGMVSFYFCDAAREAGAVVATGVPVARILPGEGVLARKRRAHRRTGRHLECRPNPHAAHAGFVCRSSLGREGAFNSDRRLHRKAQRIAARAARTSPPGRESMSRITTDRSMRRSPKPSGRPATPRLAPADFRSNSGASSTSRACMTATVAPAGLHTMSVFAQYVPYTFASGTWDERRNEVSDLALASIGRFCSNLPEAVVDAQVLGPPDIEQKVGLTGGHIFQGECLPAYMWSNRLSARTPMKGVYLCGACTHPGGSVIGINGRNAAMAVLHDLERVR